MVTVPPHGADGGFDKGLALSFFLIILYFTSIYILRREKNYFSV
jgi:hypothetical protein